MDISYLAAAFPIVTAALGGAAAWGGAHVKIKSLGERLERHDEHLRQLSREVAVVATEVKRLERMETKIDNLVKHI